MRNLGLIIGVIVAVLVVGGGIYAWQFGILDQNYPTQEQYTQQIEQEQTMSQESATQTTVTQTQQPTQTEPTRTEVIGRTYTVEEFKAKPTLCEEDSDCKIIPITCNNCDCGRAVNNWIEPYACTEADKANPCSLTCPPAKAVCDNGVCKKIET